MGIAGVGGVTDVTRDGKKPVSRKPVLIRKLIVQTPPVLWDRHRQVRGGA